MIFRFFVSCMFACLGIFSICSHDLANFDVEVIAPSSGVSKQLAQKISELIGKKIDVNEGDSEAQIFANTELKFHKLDRSLRSKHKILWAVRGGYGLDKIMPFVVANDYSKETKKIIIGYSDLTPLMIYFSQKYGWVSVNASMLRDFVIKTKSPESYMDIINFLKNEDKALKISDLKPLNEPAHMKDTVKGKITGGNVTCIVSTIGTSWQIETAGKILFLEDTNVTGFRLDRLLTHMKNTGLFSKAVAVVFGDFGADIEKILKTFASNLNIPVYKSASFGHEKVNLPFIYGTNGVISFNCKTATIEVEMKK